MQVSSLVECFEPSLFPESEHATNMELADVSILIIDDNPPAQCYLLEVFGADAVRDESLVRGPQQVVPDRGKFVSDLSKQYGVPFFVEHYDSLDETETRIAQRYRQTKDEGRLHLTIGVNDLVRPELRGYVRKSKGQFGLPMIALYVLEKYAVRLHREYGFRSVFLTNVFNYCDEQISANRENMAYVRKFEVLKAKIRGLIAEAGGDNYLIAKERSEPYGEGKITDAVVERLKDRLRMLVGEEVSARTGASDTSGSGGNGVA